MKTRKDSLQKKLNQKGVKKIPYYNVTWNTGRKIDDFDLKIFRSKLCAKRFAKKKANVLKKRIEIIEAGEYYTKKGKAISSYTAMGGEYIYPNKKTKLKRQIKKLIKK